jgi:RHS repeat-associated protein
MPLNHRSFLAILSLLLVTAVPVSAQVQNGTPPFGSFTGGPDIVDLASLNVRLSIPVLHKAGRGTDFTYDLNYDSSVWFPVTVNGTTTWTPVVNWGWAGSVPTGSGYATYKSLTTSCQYYNTDLKRYITEHYIQYSNWGYIDSFGISHALDSSKKVQDGGAPDCGPAYNTSVSAVDGSGYKLNVDGGPDASVIARDGSTSDNLPLQAPAPKVGWTDRNGNQITVTSTGSFYDTLSSSAAVLTVTGSGSPSSPVTLTYTAPNGGSPQFKMNYSSFNIKTNFGCNGIAEYSANGINLVSGITLPDGSAYAFSYEPTPGNSGYYTGRLHSVQLPTGGTITYSYTGGSNGITCADGSAATLTRTTPDGTWTYAQVKGSGAASTTTLTDPQGNVSTVQFQGIYETQRVVVDHVSGTLSTANTCYNGAASPCTGTAITLPITQRNVTTQLAGSSNLKDLHVQKLDGYGNLLEQDDYDYPNGTSLLRKTVVTYASLGNIVSFRQQVTVSDGGGHTASQTNYNYDQGTVTATSGTPQHTSASGSRGNLTSVNYYTQGSTYLTKSYTYFDTGNVQMATDVNGAQTTYTYGACGNSFPTSVSEPLGLSRSMAWNCTGGVQTSATDENSQTVTTGYIDPYFWRANSVTDQTSNLFNLWYNTYPAFEVYMAFNSNQSNVDSLSILDGLGRTHVSQTRQSPASSTYDSVETDYDSLGRPSRVTMPYAGNWAQTNPSAPATTMTYDALNRPLLTTDGGGRTVGYSYSNNDVYVTIGPNPSGENTKRRQLEYDALGRLTSVCEITSSLPGSGTCGQTSSQPGYWTKYSYTVDTAGQHFVVTQGAQTRSYVYDLMRRLTSETNPESGTTSYAYDAPTSNCNNGSWNANDPGTLVQTQDANGNVTCYYHDALGRIGTYFVIAGPGQYANSGCKHFYYDNSSGLLGSRPSGVTVNNGLGRLVAATTDNCQWPPSQSEIVTDEWFSYTAGGEIGDVWESTPHSGGYYHSSASYWANGVLNTLTASTGYSAGWSVDGEGRPSANTNTGNNPLSSTNYNTASQPTQLNFSSGDSDSYTYDPNSGRMTQYKFTVNGQSVVGNVNWNAVGTLGSLGIIDPFNSADNQTCSYTHDDLVRIASANCGSIWSQTFNYDAFGNITKNGTSSFQPTYSSTTNRMTSIGGSAPGYDSDGNVTNDFLHSYAWNGYGRPTTIDGVGVTYDALDRVVEQNRSGSYTQFLYSPTGFKMQILSGSSTLKSFVPLVGGATAVYTSSTNIYIRHADWLGSSRLTTVLSSRSVYYDGPYAPFGEPYAQTGTTDVNFTGMNQDTVANLYDFPAREYGTQGRWPSPDPAGLAAVDPTNPQSWNRYAYVGNNPLALTDPTGLYYYDCAWFGGCSAPQGG